MDAFSFLDTVSCFSISSNGNINNLPPLLTLPGVPSTTYFLFVLSVTISPYCIDCPANSNTPVSGTDLTSLLKIFFASLALP